MGELIQLPAYGWQPRPKQLPAWQALENGTKRLALSWHRRYGKDEVSLHWAAFSSQQRVGPYWHMLPQASQARKAIWDAVNPKTGRKRIDDAFPLGMRSNTRENDMFIKFRNGSTWQVVGSDNYNTLVGSPPVGVVFSEYALADPAAWALIRPILVENDGWAIFISTVRGRNHFQRMVEFALTDSEWFGQVLTVDDTKAISIDAIRRERRELTAERGSLEAEAIIQQEYYCNPDAAMPGAYYGEHMTRTLREGRIGDYPWIASLPVGIASDLGFNDQTVLWFYQTLPSGKIRIIDCIAGSNVGVDWYARRVVKRPYLITDTIWPHDGDHGNIRDVNGSSLQKQAEGYGWRPIRCLDRDHSVDIGIQAVRRLFPMLEFNAHPIPLFIEDEGREETQEEADQRMNRGLDALRGYHKEWDEKRQTFKDAPYHDWTSDYADALRYLARGWKNLSHPNQRHQQSRPRAISEYGMLG
jgi:phage terminase large subunit